MIIIEVHYLASNPEISKLSTFKRSQFSSFLLQDSDSINLLLQRKYTPKLCKTRADITYSCFNKIQAISCQLDFNSCFPSYADQNFCNLQPHARTVCCTNDTSRNVTGCSNPNVHAQFP